MIIKVKNFLNKYLWKKKIMKKSSSSSHDLLLGEVLREEMADDGDWLDSHSELAYNDNLLRGKPSGSFVGTHVEDPNELPSQLWLYMDLAREEERENWSSEESIDGGRAWSWAEEANFGQRWRAVGEGGSGRRRRDLGDDGGGWYE